MSSWFKITPETERMVSEERLVLACTELVYEAMEMAGVETKQDLARLLGVSKNEVGQRLSGKRNLTIKTLASMLHALGCEAEVDLRSLKKITSDAPEAEVIQMRQVIPKRQTGYSARPVHIGGGLAALAPIPCPS